MPIWRYSVSVESGVERERLRADLCATHFPCILGAQHERPECYSPHQAATGGPRKPNAQNGGEARAIVDPNAEHCLLLRCDLRPLVGWSRHLLTSCRAYSRE